MKIKLFAAILLLLTNCVYSQMPNVANDATWSLVFEDEFEGDTINTNWWEAPDFIFNDPNCVFINTKLAYKNEGLPNDNVIVDNGILTLTVDKLTTPINRNIHCFNGINWPNFYADITYTSGRLLSTQEFQYGYFEIKFKLPGEISGPNTNMPFGANFWLTTSSHVNSCYSELDIFEIVDGEINSYTCNSHNSPIGSPFCNATRPEYTEDGSIYGGGFGGTNISANEWHISSAHWTPEKIDYYLDGKLIKTNFKFWVDNLDAMKIILDINAPKFDYGALISLDDSAIAYPYNYDIDYVRIWKPTDDCGTSDKYYCLTEPSSFDGEIVQKSITFGGSGCSGGDFTNIDNSLYANDYILIDENITLGGGTDTLFLEVHSCY